MGIKNVYEMEGVNSTRESCLHFRTDPFLSFLKPMEKRFIEIKVLFIDVVSGLAMIKLLDIKTSCTNTMKVKFIKCTGFLNN